MTTTKSLTLLSAMFIAVAATLSAQTAWSLDTAGLKKKLGAEPAVALKAGEGLFKQSGANSCIYCHGTPEQAGKVATAAKLHLPKSWKIYKILGGDGAYAKNKEEFLKKMHDATIHLLVKGAVSHNVSYKEPWFDVAKGGGAYDSQMVGLGGPPSKAWIKKYEKTRGMTPEVAADSVYSFIKSIDTQKVF